MGLHFVIPSIYRLRIQTYTDGTGSVKLEFHGTDTDTDTDTTLGMRLSCNFVNVYMIAYRVQYTCTRVHERIPNGHFREDPRAACRTSRRGSSCVSGSWQAERGSRRRSDTPTSSRRSSRGSRRGSPCRCPCPCRSHVIPALKNMENSPQNISGIFLQCSGPHFRRRALLDSGM